MKIGALSIRISKDVQGLRRNLVTLARAVDAMARSQRELEAKMRRGGRAAGKGTARPKRPLSPADRARLKVQGEYLGLVRHLSAKARQKVKVLKAEKGYKPALKLARQLSQK